MTCEADKVETIFGSSASGTSVVGYCNYHRGWLTVPQLKAKRCLEKGCGRLEKCESPFWQERERKKEVKRFKREAGIPPYEKVAVRTNRAGNVVGVAREGRVKTARKRKKEDMI